MRLPADTKITQVTVGEARITLIGMGNRMVGRMAYLDDVGNTYGSTIFTAFSKETWRIVNLLKESMEKDFVDSIEAVGEPPSEDSPESGAFVEDAFIFGGQPG